MSKDVKTFNHGTDVIRLGPNPERLIVQGMPTELHLKTNGTLTNGPSLAIVIEDGNRNKVVGQISIEMLNEALNELGYMLIPV